MSKIFNISADCKENLHYMVNTENRLWEIKKMVDQGGDYFVINRARQYGKTTTLKALGRFLIHDYTVMSLDFQVMSASNNQVFLDFPVDMSFSAGDIEGI